VTREEYANQIKESALAIGKQAVMQFLIMKFPWMGMTIVNPIIGLLVGYILGIAIKETEFGLFYQYIDMRTGNQQSEFEKAAMENFRIQKSGTAEEKLNAEKNLIAKFRAFASLRN
jgi:hypothetical protein